MANSFGESVGHIRWLHPFRSRYLHPNYHCCHLLQSDVGTLLTSLTSTSESATASLSTISSARKPKNRLSLSEPLKRSVLKTGNAFLWLNFQKRSHFRFVHKDNAKWCRGSSRSLITVIIHVILVRLYRNFRVWKSRSLPIATGRFGTFSLRPRADFFGCRALRRVKGNAFPYF